MEAENPASRMPKLWIHLTNIFLQVASVGAGSPIGKEGALANLVRWELDVYLIT